MEIKDLIMTARQAQEMMVGALMEYVREHGDDMNDYYYNELGINEEDEEGVKVVKVLDVSDPGCAFAIQEQVNDDSMRMYWEDGSYSEAAWCCFHHHAFWAFYIVREADGEETLKYYQFHNQGLVYDDTESEPDHDNVEYLSLAQLRYIFEAIIGDYENNK